MKASIIVINYNSEKYIEQCLNSLINQSYDNIEIIFFDDCSADKSVEVAKQFKQVKILKNLSKKRTKYGSFNQMFGLRESYKVSKGDIIFTLDSDDFYNLDKVRSIIQVFKDTSKKIIVDMPTIVSNDKKYLMQNRNLSKVPTFNHFNFFPQQSCFSYRRHVFADLLEDVFFLKYPNVWFDFRASIYGNYIIKDFSILDEYLTYYRKTQKNVSSNFDKFSDKWWSRRLEYHRYEQEYLKNKNIKINTNIDFYITKLMNYLKNDKKKKK
jgi:glycosyltransferase involved in cell wall biosynthesis